MLPRSLLNICRHLCFHGRFKNHLHKVLYTTGWFGIIYLPSLVYRIYADKEARSTQTPSFSPGVIAAGWCILKIFSLTLSRETGIGVASIVPAFLFLVPVQKYINSVNSLRIPGQTLYHWSFGHIVCLVLATIIWTLVLTSTALMDSLLSSAEPRPSTSVTSARAAEIMFVEAVTCLKATNYGEAARLFQKAADKGSIDAQVFLGRMYFLGAGVGTNAAKAMALYRSAADNGSAIAQFSIGQIYYNGIYADKSYDEAAIWYRKSAEQGDAVGQYCLGIMYINGTGVAKNRIEGVKWLRKSAQQGNADALNVLRKMGEL